MIIHRLSSEIRKALSESGTIKDQELCDALRRAGDAIASNTIGAARITILVRRG